MATKEKLKPEETETDAGATPEVVLDENGQPIVSPKKSKKKLIIIAAAVVLLLAMAGGGAFFVLHKKGADKQDEAIALDEHGNPINKTVYYTLPEFLINLNSSGKSSVFLKTTVVLEVAKPTDVPLIESSLPRLVDSINTYLRELRSSDLAGSAGIQRLREEILLRVNKTIAPTQINDVLFKEIVVQ
jgi:flagellar FliL protein